MSLVVVALLAFLAGAISAVGGFGIGSIMTPVLGLIIGVKLAVPAAAIPHFAGNAARLWTLRSKIDKPMLKAFGFMSAAGAVAGALLHAVTSTHALKISFAFFLILFGTIGVITGEVRMRLARGAAWVAGFASGLLGGLIGNQGGLRAAAMLALGVPKEAFVATAVATALIVDGARLPIYAVSSGRALLGVWPIVLTATVAVLLGTAFGKALFGRLNEAQFRRAVSALLLVLGVVILVAP
jgi:uncharacterized membrane protein YfcA